MIPGPIPGIWLVSDGCVNWILDFSSPLTALLNVWALRLPFSSAASAISVG